MSIQINYKAGPFKKKSSNLVLFVDENFNITGLKKLISNEEYSFIGDLLAINDKKKKIIAYDLNSRRRIILISIKKKITTSEAEGLGAKFYDIFKDIKQNHFDINSETAKNTLQNFVGYFLHGLRLKSYIFDKYKSKKEKTNLIINILGKNIPSLKHQIKFQAVENGTFFARDLVSEPGNILHPDEYAKRLNSLKKIGLKVNVYDEKKLKKLGMNTLLGVGQGSIRGSYLVTMEWKGKKDNSKPVALVGKGVCFDKGGI